MPFLEFLFSPQAHKLRDGYFLNHDVLMAVSPQARQKLIFYFIAEQVPTKLSQADREEYRDEHNRKIAYPRTLWMLSGLFTPIAWSLYQTRGKYRQPFISVGFNLITGALLMTLMSSLYTRVYEARFVENSDLIDRMAKKYDFGIYDFSLAKKESHLLQLMHTMDNPYLTLHQ